MSEFRKVDFYIALIHIKFLNFLFIDFLNLDNFLTVLLVLSPILFSLTSLLLVLNSFENNFSNNLIVINIQISNITILLKS